MCFVVRFDVAAMVVILMLVIGLVVIKLAVLLFNGQIQGNTIANFYEPVIRLYSVVCADSWNTGYLTP